MKRIHIVLDRDWTREVFDRDCQGNVLCGDAARDVLAEIPITFHGDEFEVKSLIIASCPKQKMPARGDAETLLFECTARRVPKHLVQCVTWTVFGWERLPFDTPRRLSRRKAGGSAAEQTRNVDADLRIPDTAYDQLTRDAARITDVNTAFRQARNQLEDYARTLSPFGFAEEQHRIRSLLDFLRECLRCSADFWFGDWYAEKIPGVYRAFSELARRKKANHPAYEEERHYAGSTVSRFHIPKTWGRLPPSPDAIRDLLEPAKRTAHVRACA